MELVEYSKVPLVYFPDNVGPEDLELINRAYRKENRQGLFLSLQAPLKPLGLDGVIDTNTSVLFVLYSMPEKHFIYRQSDAAARLKSGILYLRQTVDRTKAALRAADR